MEMFGLKPGGGGRLGGSVVVDLSVQSGWRSAVELVLGGPGGGLWWWRMG